MYARGIHLGAQGDNVGTSPLFRNLARGYQQVARWFHKLLHWNTTPVAEHSEEADVTAAEHAAGQAAAQRVLRRLAEEREGGRPGASESLESEALPRLSEGETSAAPDTPDGADASDRLRSVCASEVASVVIRE